MFSAANVLACWLLMADTPVNGAALLMLTLL
jgi:hypothetical protein